MMAVALAIVLVAVLAYRLGCIIQTKRDNVAILKLMGMETEDKPWYRRAKPKPRVHGPECETDLGPGDPGRIMGKPEQGPQARGQYL